MATATGLCYFHRAKGSLNEAKYTVIPCILYDEYLDFFCASCLFPKFYLALSAEFIDMIELSRDNLLLDKKELPFHFESDLKAWRSGPSVWASSFEYWWIKSELLRCNGNFCMNCKMMKKQEIYLEAIQMFGSPPNTLERFNLESFRILCKNCIDNPHMLLDYDSRLGQINLKFPQLPSFFKFADPRVLPMSDAECSKLQTEITNHSKVFENLNRNEIKKEFIRAKVISSNSHYLIGKAARNDNFFRRNTKYSAYLSLLKMSSQKLRWHSTYKDRTFRQIFGLFDNPIRQYLVERLGGISNTSKVYAATKAEFEQNSFMGEW